MYVWERQGQSNAAGSGASLTASTGDISGVARSLEDIGHTLSRPQPPEPAQWPLPIVPEATEFLHALAETRHAHVACLSGLSSFFFDANSSLSQLNSSMTDHEHSTAAGWGRW